MKKILLVLSLLFASVAYADHDESLSNYYFTQVPVLCGTPDDIQVYVEHFKFKPYYISLGREGMVENGQPVYMITYYVSENGTQALTTIDVPSGTEKCIMTHTFDLTKPN